MATTPSHLNVLLRPVAAEFVYKALDASALPGPEAKRLALEVQEALQAAAGAAAREAEQEAEDEAAEQEPDGERNREG